MNTIDYQGLRLIDIFLITMVIFTLFKHWNEDANKIMVIKLVVASLIIGAFIIAELTTKTLSWWVVIVWMLPILYYLIKRYSFKHKVKF